MEGYAMIREQGRRCKSAVVAAVCALIVFSNGCMRRPPLNPNAQAAAFIAALADAPYRKLIDLMRNKDDDGLQRALDAGEEPNSNDALDYRPIHYAAQRGDIEAVKILLYHQARVDAATSDGDTALIEAARYGQVEALRVLVAAGADVLHASRRGLTPLKMAMHCRETAAIEPMVRTLTAAQHN